MTFVLDATAIIALLTRSSEIDEHLRAATRLVAPEFSLAEVLNVRWKYVRAKLAAPSLEAILALFDRLTMVETRGVAAAADKLSIELEHSIYDCIYAAVAQRENARLITADRKFARKLVGIDLDVLLFRI